MSIASAIAHPNIALIKYWGKADIAQNIPATSSLSLTLSNFYTHTTVKISSQEKFIINNQEISGQDYAKISNYLNYFYKKYKITQKLIIHSHNTVPYSCGLASSASGFAALTKALDTLFELKLSTKELSILSRHGSASSARSMFSGYALLNGGHDISSDQACAQKINCHPNLDLNILVTLVSTQKKHINSSQAMIHTQKTSPLLNNFLNTNKENFEKAKFALETNNFELLGTSMENSTTHMHNAIKKSNPPILYNHSITQEIINFVKNFREQNNSPVYYTQDAGPNIKILTPSSNIARFSQSLSSNFPELEFKICGSGPGAYMTKKQLPCLN